MIGASARREGGHLAELVGVTAVAVAQPVFDVVQHAPEELVNRRAGAFDLVVFTLLLTFGLPMLLWAAEQPARLAGGLIRDRVHAALVGLGIGMFAIEVVKSALGDDPHAWLWAVFAAVAFGATAVVIRVAKARSVLRYLALAAPVFAGLFLFASPVSDLVVGGTVDPADVAVAQPAPVVVIALDELPLISLLDGHGRIDADTFPAFAELAGDSTWFRNTTGVSPITPSALPAILTGRLPTETFPAPVATRFNQSLFTLLGGSYEVHAVETLTRICPPTLCEEDHATSRISVQRSLFALAGDVLAGVADPTAKATDLTFEIERNPSDALAPRRFRDFATEVAHREGTTLDVGHFLLPHQPWDFLASGHTYVAPDPPRSVESGVWYDQTIADEGRQRHLLQLRYTDRLLGHFLDEMQSTGRYDDALIVLTADHGAAFLGGQPLRGVSADNYPQVAWTPMFVKLPGQHEGAVDDRATETIDVVPTIADVLGVELPWDVDGTSMFEPAPDDRPVRMYDWRYNELEPDDGHFVVLDRDAGFREVLASSTPVSGVQRDPFALYRLGEYGSLLGEDVDDLDVGEPAGFELSSELPARVSVAPDDTSVPAYLEGVWYGEPAGWITFAVDGVLGGLGKSYPQGEYGTVWSMLAEHLLSPGDHEITAYAVSGPPDAPLLRPVPIVPVGR